MKKKKNNKQNKNKLEIIKHSVQKPLTEQKIHCNTAICMLKDFTSSLRSPNTTQLKFAKKTKRRKTKKAKSYFIKFFKSLQPLKKKNELPQVKLTIWCHMVSSWSSSTLGNPTLNWRRFRARLCFYIGRRRERRRRQPPPYGHLTLSHSRSGSLSNFYTTPRLSYLEGDHVTDALLGEEVGLDRVREKVSARCCWAVFQTPRCRAVLNF